MKKLITALFLLIFLVISKPVFSQSCLPEGIIFNTQEQIDSFQINYPGCTAIEGSVSIIETGYNTINNLEGLSVLTSIGGNLKIGEYNDEFYLGLENFNGLNNLVSITGSLRIVNVYVDYFTGFDNLTSVGGSITVSDNIGFPDLYLNNIQTVGGSIVITNDTDPHDIHFSNLSTIGGSLTIGSINYLQQISHFENLTSINGDFNRSLFSCSQ